MTKATELSASTTASENPAPAIIARDLGLTYPGAAPSLQGVDLDVAQGEFVSIVGPSGCGKSTLLRLIAELREPTTGSVRVNVGEVQAGVRTAFVFQEPNLLPWRNVAANIRLPFEIDATFKLAIEKLGKRPVSQLIDGVLQLIGLTSQDALKLPAQLSGGMRMRVSLARALVTEPEILLLDEPFAALDDILRQQLNEDLQRIWWQKRWTAVFVTHNVAEAVFQSQRVLVMSRAPGRLVDEIKIPFDFPRRHSLRATAEFAQLTGEVTDKLRKAAEVQA